MKQALCIKTPPVMPRDGVYNIHDTMPLLPVELVDRAQCETDGSTQQLIPYILVRNQEGEYFTYTRGKGGDENRLHAKLSIGLGGHVECRPARGENLMELLQAEGARELSEEIGLTVHPHRPLNFSHIVIDRNDAVGRVHVGLVACYTLQPNESIDFGAEKGIIDGASFKTLEQLNAAYDHLENWSKQIVDYLNRQGLENAYA